MRINGTSPRNTHAINIKRLTHTITWTHARIHAILTGPNAPCSLATIIYIYKVHANVCVRVSAFISIAYWHSPQNADYLFNSHWQEAAWCVCCCLLVRMCARVWVFLAMLCVIMPACVSLLYRDMRYLFALFITCVCLIWLCCFFKFSIVLSPSLPFRQTMCKFIAHFYSHISHFIFEFIFDEHTKKQNRKKPSESNWTHLAFCTSLYLRSLLLLLAVSECVVSKSKSNLFHSILEMCSALLTIKCALCAKSIVSIFPIPPIHRSSKNSTFSSLLFVLFFCSHLSIVNFILCTTFCAIDTLAIRFSRSILTIDTDCERTVRSFQSVRLMNQSFVYCS